MKIQQGNEQIIEKIACYAKAELLQHIEAIDKIKDPVVIEALMEKTAEFLPSFSKNELVHSFMQIAKTNQYNDRCLRGCVDRGTNLIAQFTINDCAEFGKGLTKVGYKDASFFYKWRKQASLLINLQQAPSSDGNHFSAYSSILWTIAKMNFKAETDWHPIINKCLEYIDIVGIPYDNRKDLTNLLWSMGKLRIYHPVIVLNLIEKLMDVIPSFSAEEVTKTIDGVANLSYYHEAFLNALIEHGKILLSTGNFSIRAKVNNAFYLATMMINHNITDSRISEFVSSLLNPADFQFITRPEAMHQLLTTFKILRMRGLLKIDIDDITPRWTKEIREDLTVSTSKSQKKVFKYVQGIAPTAIEEEWLDCIKAPVDIFIPFNQDKTSLKGFIIQFHGPTHYYLNKQEFETATTKLSTALIDPEEYASLCVKYSSLDNDDYESVVRTALKPFKEYFAIHKITAPKVQSEIPLSFSNRYTHLELYDSEVDESPNLVLSSSHLAIKKTNSKKKAKYKTKEQQDAENDKFLDELVIVRESEAIESITPLYPQEVKQYVDSFNKGRGKPTPVTLHKLVAEGNISLVSAVIAYYNATDKSKLHTVLNGKIGNASALELAFSAVFTEDGTIVQKNVEICEILLNAGAIIANTTHVELKKYAIMAIEAGKHTMLESIVKINDYGNNRDDMQFLFGYAAIKKDTASMRVIYKINNHINPNEQNKDGISALHYACSVRDTKTAEFLLEDMHANPNLLSIELTDGVRITPLFYAIAGKDDATFNLLWASSDINKDLVFTSGFSLLHMAALSGSKNMVEQIIAHNNDPSFLNQRCLYGSGNSTPMDLALTNGDKGVIGILSQKGAEYSSYYNYIYSCLGSPSQSKVLGFVVGTIGMALINKGLEFLIIEGYKMLSGAFVSSATSPNPVDGWRPAIYGMENIQAGDGGILPPNLENIGQGRWR